MGAHELRLIDEGCDASCFEGLGPALRHTIDRMSGRIEAHQRFGRLCHLHEEPCGSKASMTGERPRGRRSPVVRLHGRARHAGFRSQNRQLKECREVRYGGCREASLKRVGSGLKGLP